MNVIVDDIKKVVELIRLDYTEEGNTAPFYMYGHRLEIARNLTSRPNGKVFTYQKYPLIALRLDIPEEHEDGFIKYKLNIGIFAFTDKNYTAEQRYEKVFKPVLYPLYDLFIKALYDSGLFSWSLTDLERPRHTKIDRPFWGVSAVEQNTANIFSDPLDAIELLNLEINSKKRC
jgi:hypothetical protein